jgi:hypothetical protein
MDMKTHFGQRPLQFYNGKADGWLQDLQVSLGCLDN